MKKPILDRSLFSTLGEERLTQLKSEAAALHSSTHCLCCNLPISERMIQNSAKRSARSSKKPTHQLEAGPFEGRFICKQCMLPYGDMHILIHTSEDEADAALAEYRRRVGTRMLRTFSRHDAGVESLIRQFAETVNLGDWKSHMRAPDYAQMFWVLVAILRDQGRD